MAPDRTVFSSSVSRGIPYAAPGLRTPPRRHASLEAYESEVLRAR
jgi:hypothetical protein